MSNAKPRSSDPETLFTELLHGHYGQWAGIARVYATGQEVEDLVQEICLQVWRALPKFEGRSAPGTWAYRIALNTALGWDRAAKRRKRLKVESSEVQHLPGPRQGPREGASGVDGALSGGASGGGGGGGLVERFAAGFSKVDRAVLLVYLEKMPSDEASAVTGLSPGAVRVRMHRLKKRFQDFYAKEEAS